MNTSNQTTDIQNTDLNDPTGSNDPKVHDGEILEPLPDEQLGGPLEPVREGHPAWNKIPDEVRDQIIEDVLKTGNFAKTAENFGLNRVTVAAVIKEFRAEVSEFIDFKYQARIENILDKLLQRLENEAGEIKLSQLPVSVGILLDKRRELRGNISGGNQSLNLKVAWRDGSGAVELTTNGIGMGGNND
ncbi:MAG: hypothetical protein A4E53_00747 [Pelotomaculum sp. PtaB.Bin104]|nr:MAG: hypothetical protein A4E53_00747 [Pelotomaculum sp. PtaB.Bin104]